MSVSVGDKAPAFTLPSTGGTQVSLSDFAGRPVVLVFYPGDDTPVCTKQLNSYNDDLAQFEALDAQVLGISAQSVDSHEKFAGKHGFVPTYFTNIQAAGPAGAEINVSSDFKTEIAEGYRKQYCTEGMMPPAAIGVGGLTTAAPPSRR